MQNESEFASNIRLTTNRLPWFGKWKQVLKMYRMKCRLKNTLRQLADYLIFIGKDIWFDHYLGLQRAMCDRLQGDKLSLPTAESPVSR
jgi:hypothetical protein